LPGFASPPWSGHICGVELRIMRGSSSSSPASAIARKANLAMRRRPNRRLLRLDRPDHLPGTHGAQHTVLPALGQDSRSRHLRPPSSRQIGCLEGTLDGAVEQPAPPSWPEPLRPQWRLISPQRPRVCVPQPGGAPSLSETAAKTRRVASASCRPIQIVTVATPQTDAHDLKCQIIPGQTRRLQWVETRWR
jgi:hypothetical protein